MTRADQYRATRKEQALWLLERLVPDTAINNVAFALRVEGRFRTPDLQAALDTVVDRYEVLRAVFVEDEGTLTKRVEPAMLIPLTESEVPEAELQPALDGFAAVPFALDGQPLLRVRLVRTPTADVLCVVAHHLIFDAISSTILLRSVIAVYEQIGRGLPPLADTIPARAEPSASEQSLAFWRSQLDGFIPGHQELALRGDLVGDGRLRGGAVTRDLSAESLEALRALQKQVRCPEAAVLLAAYAVLLTRHGAGHDVVLGAPVDVRQEKTPSSIGYHINVVPIRLTLDRADTFRSLARRCRDTFLAALAHADASVDDLLAELPRLGSSWRDTLYRHLFNYVVDTDGSELTVDGMPARTVGVENGNSKFDLELFVTSRPGGVRLRVAYYRGALRHEDAERFLDRFEALLLAVAADPESELAGFDAWDSADHHVITAANGRDADPVRESALEAIATQVVHSPDATAVIERGQKTTYAQLWRSACGTAEQLRRQGAGRGDRVRVSADRGVAWLTGVLGVWLAEATCVLGPAGGTAGEWRVPEPDPTQPGAPIAEQYDAKLPDTADLGAFTTPADDRAPGTVTVNHYALASCLAGLAAQLNVEPADAMSWDAPTDAPASVIEALLPLTCGAAVVVDDDTAGGRRVVLGGDVDSASQARAASATADAAVLVHGWPATSFWSFSRRVTPTDSGANAGYPMPGVEVVVLGGGGRSLPVGVVGEICVLGRRLADAEPGDARFADHHRYGTHYRTGQLGRWLADGSVEFLGRIDRHVNIRGTVLALDQIEAQLRRLSGDARVVAGKGDEAVLAVVAGLSDRLAVENHLRSLLPSAVASRVVSVQQIPLRPDGTVDYAELRRMAAVSAADDVPRAGLGSLETTLLRIWQALLPEVDVTPETHFFLEGGHSLLAAKLAQDIEEVSGVGLELPDIFEHPTPAALARHLQAASAA